MFAVPKQVDQSFSSFTTKGTRVDLFYTYLAKKVVISYILFILDLFFLKKLPWLVVIWLQYIFRLHVSPPINSLYRISGQPFSHEDF